MSVHRMTAFAYRKRAALFEVLGKKCAACGVTKDLEFDVIEPTPKPGSHHANYSFAQRMIFYCRQLQGGNLQVLCHRCNPRKGRGTQRYIEPLLRRTKNNPF